MQRRDFLKVIACSTAPWPLTARAQPSRTRPLIAWMSGQTRTLSSPFFGSFLKGMRDLGHVEGQNFDILYRFSDGYGDRLPIIGEELAQIKPTIVVATAVDCAVAMRRFTSTIPIVSGALADAVHLGLIASEARPGGNVTGVQPYVPGLPAKQLELALEIAPSARKIGILTNLQDPKGPPQAQELEAAAKRSNVTIVATNADRPEEIEAALRSLADQRPDVVIVLQTSTLLAGRNQIAASTLEKRLARGVAAERPIIQAAGPRPDRPCDLHARFGWSYSQLEFRRTAHQGVHGRGDYRPALFAVLYGRGPGNRRAPACPRNRAAHRPVREGRLAGPKR
jgi:ABC transporter substrate binding protein